MLDLHDLTLERDGPDGPFTVVRGVDLVLADGERLALLGGNGSGKSSLLRHLALPGVLPGLRVALVCQDPDEQLVTGTVGDELQLGRSDIDVPAILAEFGLDGCQQDDPRLLSAGEKQRLQLAIALGLRPDLLLLDEPGSLQDPAQARWLCALVSAWPGSVVWATQRPGEAALCHGALVLADGVAVASGPVSDVLTKAVVQPLWERPEALAPAIPAPDAVEIARLEQVECRFVRGGVTGLSLRLVAGQRLGIFGPNGCGKSTLLSMLAGLRRPDAGGMSLMGRRRYGRRGTDLDHGLVALAPQFPEYLFATGSVAAEVRLAGGDLSAVLEAAGLPRGLAQRHPHDLSGGQKRRLALAIALDSGRPLVLLDEPTAALDASGRRSIVAMVRRLPPATALVVASHDQDFLAACGCRVMELGPNGLVDPGWQ